MIDLKDTTFIIPVRIESDDRLRNVITVCCFLLENFDTKVIIKEVDKDPVFEGLAFPQISEYVEDSIKNLTHIYEVPDDSVFYRMRYLNEMLAMVETDVVANYDSDVLLPIDTYVKAQEMCKGEYDLVYPYGQGMWQKQIFADDNLVSDFLSNDCKFDILERQSKDYDAQSGHVQFFKRESYIKGGMENENFKAWGPEDEEKHYRFPKLGYNIGRIFDWVYHLEHSRGDDSERTNIYFRDNLKLMEDIRSLSVEELRNYYNTQEYLKKYHD